MQEQDSNASPDNTLRFQNWYVTNSSGSHTIGYSYTGGIAVENLSVINTGMPRTVDPIPEDGSDQRAPDGYRQALLGGRRYPGEQPPGWVRAPSAMTTSRLRVTG